MRTINQYTGIIILVTCIGLTTQVPAAARPALTFHQDNAETKLFSAIKRGATDEVRQLIAGGVNLNARDEKDRTPIMIAALKGEAEALRILIEAGADSNLRDAESNSTIAYAAAGGNPEAIRLLVRAGQDVNTKDPFGFTAVHAAATHGQGEAIRALVAAGATGVDLLDQKDVPPIIYAIWGGHTDAVRALLEAGASPDALPISQEDSKRKTYAPLTQAARNGHAEIVRLLFEAGLSADLKNLSVQNALTNAAWNGRTDAARVIVDWSSKYEGHEGKQVNALWSAVGAPVEEALPTLLATGIDINGELEWGGTLLRYASRGSPVEQVRRILEHGGDPNARDARGETPLFMVHTSRNPITRRETIKLLLDAGADASATSKNGSTLLHVASYSSITDRESVQLYIDAGAEIDARDSTGRTPLLMACSVGKEELVRFYIEAGANLEARNSSGETPLMAAAHRGKPEVLRILLERGANIDATTKSGDNALMIALSEQGREEEVVDPSERARALIESGIDLSQANSGGLTALDLALRRRLDDVAELIKERAQASEAHIPASGASLLAAAAGGDAETVAKMIREGVDVNFTGQRDLTPTHAAAGSGVAGSIRALAAAGADFNRQDSSGYLPLNYAVKRNDVEKIRALIEGGADPNRREKLGFSILSRALNRKTNIDTIRALIEGGADVNAPDRKFGLPPIFGAVGTGDMKKVQLLIDSGAVAKAEVGYRNLYAHAGSTDMLLLLFKYTGTPEMDSEIAHDLVRSKAQSGNIELLKFLIDAGAAAEPDIPGRHTPLMGAARNGHVETVRFLLEAGSNANAVEKYRGRTVLMEAAEILRFKEKKGVPTVRLLLEAGADPSIKDKSGMTALMLAEEKGNKEIAKIIKDALR